MVTVAFVGAVHPRAAAAANYYVATNGNDGNPGTQVQPFQTIHKGLSVVRAGDTLFLRGGTYNEAINSNSQTIPTGSSWTDAPRIAAYPSETVVLQGSYGNGINLAASYIHYVIFDGLIVDGGGVSMQNGANHVRFQNGEVRNALGQGIQGGFGSTATTNLELLNMRIHNNGNPTVISESPGSGGRYDHGIYVAISNLLIDGCDIHDNTGYGIQIYDSSGGRANNAVIRNNRIHDNKGDGNVTLNYGDNILFYNNLVYNGLNGVSMMYSVTNTKVYNNTIYNHPSGAGVQVQSGSSGAAIINNILYQDSSGFMNYGASSVTTSNNLTTNPQFVNAGAANFHLQATSPAIDAGKALTAVPVDFDGLPRPAGSAYDIGAYEYGASGPTAPQAPQNLRIIGG
jgi:Right handed beta helix region/Protein of unknown function (DUF1565)